jgi:hypothetical protein
MTNKIVNGQVIPLTDEEETAFVAANAAAVLAEPASKWARIRLKRDQLLAASDWMANSDVTMSDAWTTYRQALRDITTQDDPDDITWPTEP